MKHFVTMLFALLLLLCSRDAITTDPKGDSASKKTKMMSHRPDLYAFTQVISPDNPENADGIVLLRGLLETMSQSSVVIRKIQVLITASDAVDSSQDVLGYLLLINHHPIQYVASSSCDLSINCNGKGKVTSASYTFNDVDCLVKQSTTIVIEVEARFKNNHSVTGATRNSPTAQLVWLGVEKIFRDSSGNFITEEGKSLFANKAH